VSQQDYVTLYRRMLLEAHAQAPFLSPAEFAQVRRPDLSRLGGRALLEPYGEAADVIRNLGPQVSVAALEAAYLDRPVGETVGRLRCVGHLLRKLDARDQHHTHGEMRACA
jgi:hypothetical protein